MKVGDLVRAKDHPRCVGIVVSFPEPRRRKRTVKARPLVEIYYLDGETMIHVLEPFDWEVISEGG